MENNEKEALCPDKKKIFKSRVDLPGFLKNVWNNN
jgi:hypothetical protein